MLFVFLAEQYHGIYYLSFQVSRNMESICELKILNVPNILLHSKSDDWKIFNNFGRSMFAGLVERLLHVNFAILKNWYIGKFVCLI